MRREGLTRQRSLVQRLAEVGAQHDHQNVFVDHALEPVEEESAGGKGRGRKADAWTDLLLSSSETFTPAFWKAATSSSIVPSPGWNRPDRKRIHRQRSALHGLGGRERARERTSLEVRDLCAALGVLRVDRRVALDLAETDGV